MGIEDQPSPHHMRTIHTLLFLATFPAMLVARELPRASAAATTDPHTTEHAAGPVPAGLPAGQPGFEENKGQVRTTTGDAAPFVRYRFAQGNTQLYLLNDGIAYQFSRMHYPTGYAELMATAHHDRKQQEQLAALRDQVRLETYRMNMHLEGADPAARISTEGRSIDYTQYYTHDALDVHSYTKVVYHDVYPGIDWVVYTTEQGMKYDFIVRPGADPNLIRLRFEHHEELEVNAKGELIHGNRMGRFTEAPPVSFQGGNEITSRFVLEGDLLRFKVGHYDRTRTLTIDPARVWGTYYGGSGEDLGWTCATDASGNVYVSGFSNSTNAIAQAGHQNTNAGGVDAFLVKFDANGTRQWGTYYGGSDTDMAHHCAVDNAGNVYLAGATASLTNIASGGHQNTHGTGGNDAFLVKFDAGGTRLWGTYYGGGAGERGFYCATDNSGNVYLCGETASATQIASNGHQNTYSNDNEAFLVKFNANGTRLWGTYYGGSGGESGESCSVDGNGNVYLAGFTTSTSGIASGGHQNTLGGSTDAFLAKFNASGVRQWGTYYGSTGADNGWSCAVDGSGNVYLVGNTASSTGIASGGHQNTYGGAPSDGFLVKFNTAGNRHWATYYGGDGDELAYSCAVDNNGDVFIGGHTSSPSGIAADGFQNTYGGGANDAFLAKFNAAGVRSWATYYGGAGHDGGYHTGIYGYSGVRCAVDGAGNAYLTGSTTSTSGIAANGHQDTYGGIRDGFLVKFAGDPGIATGSIVGTVCVGSPVSVPFSANGYFDVANTFTAQLSNAAGSFTSPVDIGSLSGTESGTIEATIPGGTPSGSGYRIRVVASDPATLGEDNGADLAVTAPGSPCDDGDPTTNNDTLNEDCECIGEPDCVISNFTESEPNNVVGEADPVPMDTKVQGSMGACGPADNSMDIFLLPLSGAGGIRVEACMYNSGPEALPVFFQLRTNAGSLVEAFTLQAGPDGEPVTSVHVIGCNEADSYQLRILVPSTVHCTHYGVTWSTITPVFAADVEPNNSLSTAIPTAYDTYQEGHLAFEGGSPFDFYDFTPPTDGVMTFEVQAEHAGAEADSLELVLWGIETWILPVGANGVPVTSTVSIPCRALTEEYTITLQSFACGTSYKWKYWMTPPVFANDVEPNNSTPGTPLAHDTFTEGHLAFTGGSPYDFFAITPSTNGVMTFEVQAEHVGAEVGSLEFHLNGIQTWNIPVGANDVPAPSTFSIDCRGNTTTYTVRLASMVCGTSYRWKYTMTPALFANDLEPNNNIAGATAMDLENGSQYGNIGFHGQTDADYFSFVHPGGPWSVTVSAEHAGTAEGSMTMHLINSSGSNFGTFAVPVGGSSETITSSFELTTLAAGTYLYRLTAVTCGVSYLIHCTDDADLDGTCDAADVCPDGPEPGTPCDDEDPQTVNDVITDACVCEGDITTGLADAEPSSALRLWPNPALDALWIEVAQARGAAVQVMVRDLTGRLVIARGSLQANAQGQLLLDLSPLTPGTYVIEVQANGQRWSRRVVKA